ncbi:putative chemoreceptor glutamine deamidase CheD 3 [Pseudomonas sp. 8Z]|uniref:chemotaxis protein CheD n=1 Tax=Pseudomonas sp. 8Z TaxID=2653166 RepID=UPI0012EF84AE|nr:chemotaxis protein CheD [Pseudomonas sp. 8Z]VXC96538.1 putative chemoreceptor glutamine deamidase CheD 3 [Pseudomonas sp. 8Z]
MPRPAVPHEVYLRPGDLHFTGANTRIRTLLGSCVSLVFWHPRRRLGGMCHYMLPTRGQPTAKLDGRYGDEAMLLLLEAIHAHGTHASEYHLRIFGGGNMFPSVNGRNKRHIGQQNIDMAYKLLAMHGLRSHGEHVGGTGHRHLIFDISSGQLALKLSPNGSSSGAPTGVLPT